MIIPSCKTDKVDYIYQKMCVDTIYGFWSKGPCKEFDIKPTFQGCISVRERSAKRVCERKLFFGESFDVRRLFAMHLRHKASSRMPSWLKASVGPHYAQRGFKVNF